MLQRELSLLTVLFKSGLTYDKRMILLTLQRSILLSVIFLLTLVRAFAQDLSTGPAAATDNSAWVKTPVAVNRKAPNPETYVTTVKSQVESKTGQSTGLITAVTSERANPASPKTEVPAKAPRQAGSPSDWEFAFTPYFYMTGLKGTIGARGRTSEIDMSFADIFNSFKFGLMGALEAKKGKFVIVNDLMWVRLGEERDTPGGLYSSRKLGVNLFVLDPEAGYRVYESDDGSFDVLGGVRIMSVETHLDFRTGSLPGFDVSQRKTWATPVVGGRGLVNVSKKVFLSTKFDIGGGLGADLTGQFYGGVGYRLRPKIALIGGYRYLKTDYDDDSGFLFDTSMNGIVLGAKFEF